MVRQPDGQADKAASGKRRRFQPAWPGQPPSWKTKARWTRNTQVGSLGSIIARSSVPGRRDWSRMAASRPGALKPLPLSRACRGYDIQDRQGQEMSDLMILSDILTSAVSSDNRFLVFWAHQKKSSKMSVSVVMLLQRHNASELSPLKCLMTGIITSLVQRLLLNLIDWYKPLLSTWMSLDRPLIFLASLEFLI